MAALNEDIPRTCRAGCVVNVGNDFSVVLEDVPVPEPGHDEILLRLSATGLCYTDIHLMLDDLPMPKMLDYGVRSPGHEAVGVVVKLGSNVKSWKIGDRGGVKPLWDVCSQCARCWGGQETYCKKAVHTGCMVTGTYQSYMVSPAKYTTPIPDEVDDFTAAPMMCAGSTMLRSIRTSGLLPGDWAVFCGAGGGVGHIGVQIARAMGMRVIGLDGGDEKGDLCMKLGCEAFVDFSKTKNVEEEVLRITGGEGAHGVFVTATSPSAYKSAPLMVRVGGTVMCIGLPPWGTAFAGADPAIFIGNNLHMIGTQVGSMKDTHDVLEYAARGLVKPVYELYPFSKLPEAVSKLRSGKVAGRCVIDFNA
ncbi:chaperonin 10-like protein [Leptodontidium sp. 2 PMI_412]|nr:chaperonin 10-like protein [Leptodontidium sp. 2 PMI_412]